jgi:hypothetical protein
MPPLMWNPRPLVFTDPREVILYELKRRDGVLCHDVGPITHSDLFHRLLKFAYETRSRKKLLLDCISKGSMINFLNLHGNDYPSMKLIYPALRGAVESGPEDVPPGRTGAAR